MINQNTKSSYKNPELDESLQDSALNNRGGNNWGTETFISLNHFGTPKEKINVDSYLNDFSSYWALHEKKLWIIFSFCLLYLAMKLLGS